VSQITFVSIHNIDYWRQWVQSFK